MALFRSIRILISFAFVLLIVACQPVRPTSTATLPPSATSSLQSSLAFTPVLSLTPTLTPTLTSTPTIQPTATSAPSPTPTPDLRLVPQGARARLSKGPMTSLQLSLDGQTIAVGSNNTVCVYQVIDGHQNWCSLATTSDNFLQSLSFNPQGNVLAGVSSGNIIFWDAATGTYKRMIQTVLNLSSNLTWSPDGNFIANEAYDESGDKWDIYIWNSQSGQLVHTIDIMHNPGSILRWSPDGSRIAGASSNKVAVWDAKTGDMLFIEPDFYDMNAVFSLDWSSDNTKLLVGTGVIPCPENCATVHQGKIKILNTGTGAQLREINVGREVDAITYSPDGRQFMAALSSNEILVYNADDGHPIQRLIGGGATGAAWLPDGKRLVASNGLQRLFVWDVATGDRTDAFLDDYMNIIAMAWSPDSTRLVTTSLDGAIYIWDVTSGRLIRNFGKSYPSMHIVWSPDGRQIATTQNTQILIWDAQTGKLIEHLEGGGFYTAGIGWTRDGRYFASLCPGINYGDLKWDGALIFWDTRDWSVVRAGKIGNNLNSMAWAPDGKSLATGGDQIAFWDPFTGKQTGSFNISASEYTGEIIWSMDMTRLLSTKGGWFYIWNIKDQRQIAEVGNPDGVSYFSMALSPDGKTLATGWDTIGLRDANDGKLLRTLGSNAGGASSLAFSPNGKTLASYSNDGTILLWDVPG